LVGIKDVDYTTENWIRHYRREKYVYDELVENAKKHNLIDEELFHYFRFFDGYYVLQLII